MPLGTQYLILGQPIRSHQRKSKHSSPSFVPEPALSSAEWAFGLDGRPYTMRGAKAPRYNFSF
jgi:hypothetical protein